MSNEEHDNLQMPKSRYLEAKKATAKNQMTHAFDEYKALLRDKVHPDNQTAAYNKRVAVTLQRLLTAADELDSVVPGEGIFGLIVLCLRTNLKLKDQNVELESEVEKLKREINKLKKR